MSRAKRQRQKQNTRAAREAREAAQKRRRRKSAVIRAVVAVVVVALAVGIAAFVSGGDGDDTAGNTSTTVPGETTTTVQTLSAPDFALDAAIDYSAKITTNFGEIVVDLDETAPVGAGHFVKLAKEGFYDGLTWHRAAADFVIQGGDPNGDGSGGTGQPLVAELPTDNYPLGSLAAAKAPSDPAGTFDSQFFVVTGSRGLTLPNEYARFGTVTSGLEVAQAIERLAPAEGDGAPTSAATIDKVEIIETPRPTDTTTTAATTTTATP